MTTIEGNITAANYKFAVVVSRFNETISENLLKGTLDGLKRHGCKENNITIVKVPGAFEIPIAAEKLSAQKKYDAVICLGAVIRGATPHFEYVSGSCSNGIMQVMVKHSVPIIFGVLTTDTVEQAFERSGIKGGNKGWDAAIAAVEMADLSKKLA
jgi:6,7-dimethyl-8-ribityllumazine synthase